MVPEPTQKFTCDCGSTLDVPLRKGLCAECACGRRVCVEDAGGKLVLVWRLDHD